MTTAYPEILQLTHRFYYCLDEFRYQDLAALMREDGVWHRQGKVLKGRAQVIAALEERPRTQRIRHVITNAFLSAESERAADLVAYLTAYKYDDGKPIKGAPTIDGPFRMLLVKKRFVREGGGWMIAESAGTPEFEFRGK
jgi:hypothetical protein